MAETINQNKTSTTDQINIDSGIASSIISFFKTDVRFNSASVAHQYKNKNVTVNAAFENYFYDIQDPAWYPDSLVRAKKKNLYNHMLNTARYMLTYTNFIAARLIDPKTGKISKTVEGISDKEANLTVNSNKALDFYYRPGDKLDKLLDSAVQSVVSYAYSQVSGIVDAIESLPSLAKNISSKLGLTEDNEEEKPRSIYSPESLFFSTQPMIDVQGFMIDERLIQQLKVTELSVKTLMNLFEDNGALGDKNGVLANLTSSFSELFKNLVIKTILPVDQFEANKNKNLSEIMSLAKRPDARLHGLAEKVFMSMIYGTYKAHFRIPMPQNGNTFSEGDGQSGWQKAESPLTKGGELLSDIGNNFSEVNIPNVFMRKQWRQDSVSNSGRRYSCGFYLFNDTIEHFMLNFNYIIHLHALCSPTTDAAFIRPPYLFNLRLPGGLRYLLCTCKCTVSNRGKIRKLGSKEYVLNIIKHITEQLDFITELTSEELTYCPDAYEVQLNFTSLIPNTWNFDQAYLTNTNIGIPSNPNQSIDLTGKY